MASCRSLIRFGIIFISLATCKSAFSQSVQTIAVSGQSAPGAGGANPTFSGFTAAPTINSAGQVVFTGNAPRLDNPGQSGEGIWRWTQGTGVQFIAQVGSPIPGTAGNYSSLPNPLVSNIIDQAGTVIFRGIGAIPNSVGFWAGTPGAMSLVANIGGSAPGITNANYSTLDNPAVLNNGRVAFTGSVSGGGTDASNNFAIWTGSLGSVQLAVRFGDGAPGFAGATFNGLSSPLLNGNGTIAFLGNMTGGGLNSTNNSALWTRAIGGSPQLVARTSNVLNGMVAGETLESFNGPVGGFNNNGDVLFGGRITGATVNATNDFAFWVGRAGGTTTLAVREGQQAPGTPAGITFDSVQTSEPNLNRNGQVSFQASLTGAGVNASNDGGIWAGTPGNLQLIAREGNQAAGASAGVNYAFDNFVVYPAPNLAGGGQVVFMSDLTGTGVNSSNNKGVWISDLTGEVLNVARKGDNFTVAPGDVRTISDVVQFGVSNGSDGQKAGINDNLQIPLLMQFTNGTSGIFQWTPDLNWRSTGSGSDSWDNNLKWTLSANPASVHRVTIAPPSSVTVTGPSANTTVRSLQVGGGTGTATLVTQAGVTLTATQGITITSNGVVAGNGTLSGAVSVLSGGQLNPGAIGSVGTLNHQGTMTLAGGSVLFVDYTKSFGTVVAGVDYDHILSTGSLSITANSGNRIIVQLDHTGIAVNPTGTFTFELARFNAGISGFDPNAFVLQGEFFETLPPVFELVNLGGGVQAILVTFVPVPEPATCLGFACIGLAGYCLRRRAKRTQEATC